MIKKHIPNSITLLNLFSGSMAVIVALEGSLLLASALLGLSAVFDFFDGFVARLLKVKSDIGKELDSLADVISFGLAPSVILFYLIREHTRVLQPGWTDYVPYTALLIAGFSALRLAKFNLDTRQTDSFLGLPTPANALFIASLPFFSGPAAVQDAGWLTVLAGNPVFLLVLIPVSCIMLVSEIPLLAMKFSHGFSFKDNKLKYLLVLLAIAGFLFLQWASIPLLVMAYVLISLAGRNGNV